MDNDRDRERNAHVAALADELRHRIARIAEPEADVLFHWARVAEEHADWRMLEDLLEELNGIESALSR